MRYVLLLLCIPLFSASAYAAGLAGWLQANPLLSHLAVHDKEGYEPQFKLMEPGGSQARELLLKAGAFALRAEHEVDEEQRLLATVLLARALWMSGEREDARTQLQRAMAQVERLAWNDAQAHGLLRDLALFYRARQNEWQPRIDACSQPCTEERLSALVRELMAQSTTQPPEHERLEAELAFAERHYSSPSAELAHALVLTGKALEEVRPLDALDYYQRALEQQRKLDRAPHAQLELELAIARLLLRSGDYPRLAVFSDALVARLSQSTLSAQQARQRNDLLRIRARGRRHQFAADQEVVYNEALAALDTSWSRQQAHDLLVDLFDTELHTQTVELLARLRGIFPHDLALAAMQARLYQRRGKLADAIAHTREQLEHLLAIRRKGQAVAIAHQLAAYLREAGQESEAVELTAQACDTSPRQAMRWMLELRDHGAYEAAACLAKVLDDEAEEWALRGDYVDAQALWQLAYTHARVGHQERAFSLMRQAARIAVRHSFGAVEATSGGSLQLLKRDRWRYLLFLDIAWGARSGGAPQGLSVTSRY